ncbi:putative Phosphatidylinositol 4-kinase [Paratrimastix pyriformis]|uniref:Phosphatidylinositol 4-kinase n=1 Tax=Paratrimastix pyriformis TaxID=342808 RepID=A0ABQ8UM36_9EUKA|nr:putative Phosphatidylinositol 4-kinase [Paratrimastix pyriformis]
MACPLWELPTVSQSPPWVDVGVLQCVCSGDITACYPHCMTLPLPATFLSCSLGLFLPYSLAPANPAETFFETFRQRCDRIKAVSPDGHRPGWNLESFIVKESDDVRQDQLITQLLAVFLKLSVAEGVNIWLKPYTIVVTGPASGLVESIYDAVSLHTLKSKAPGFTTLSKYFGDTYGPSTSPCYQTAIRNFVQSMAGYSIATHLLQVKDRHNGNIMIDLEGHLVHIDFGFILGHTPGEICWENAPFKLTAEMVEVMGGLTGSAYNEYRRLCVDSFMCLRKHYQKIVGFVELMARDSSLPCFANNPNACADLHRRFVPELTTEQARQHVQMLINQVCVLIIPLLSLRWMVPGLQAYSSWRTGQYDTFQRLSNGILP